MEISPFNFFQKRFEPFFDMRLSLFSRAFSPFRMEKSPFRMEISPFNLFQKRFEPFFEICLSFFSRAFSHSEWGNLHLEWRFLHSNFFRSVSNLSFFKNLYISVFRSVFSIQNGEIPLNGEFSVLNGDFSVLHSEWRNHRFEWKLLRTFLISNLFFVCGTLDGLHPFPKNETICIQNGDVPFLEGYLFILVVGLARGIRDISIIFSSKEWIHHTFTCRNLICVLKFVVRHRNMNRCFFLRGIYNLEVFMQ